MVENRLKEILTREKVRAYRFHKDLGLVKGNPPRFFSGKQNISLKKLEQIADYLGYDIQFVKPNPSRKGGK